MANAASYIGNLGKSIAYSAVDKVKEMTPAASSFVETNQELFKEVYSSIKNYKMTVNKTAGWFKQTKVYEAGDQFKESIFEDIRTGKFYNKDRIDKIAIKSMGSLGDFGDSDGFDFSSLDSFGDDLVNDDFGSWDGAEGDKLVSNTIAQASLSSAEAISKTMAKSSEYIVESNKIATNILYTQNAKAYSLFNQNLASINQNITNVLNFSTSTLQTHAENSKLYYETTTKLLQEQTALLKQLVDYNTPKASTKTTSNNKKVTYEDIVDANGAPDLKQYAKAIQQNIMNKMGSVSSLNSAFGSDSNMLLNAAASPLKVIPDLIINKIVPMTIQKSMEQLNKSLEGFFGSIIMKFNGMSKSSNPFLQTLGAIFGINSGIKSSIDTGNYNKGPVPFDGKTRKAIIDVIPAYLRRIEAALTGTAERIFDFDKGAYSGAGDVKKEFEKEKSRFSDNATSDMKQYFMEASQNMIIENKRDQQKFMEEMGTFFKKIYSNNELFDVSSKNNDYSKYGISPTNFELFKNMYASSPRHMQQGINANILSQRQRENSWMQGLEDNSDGGIYSLLFDRSGSGDFNSKKGPTGFAGGLLNAKDNLGHNVFYYMQKSLVELMKLVKLNTFSAGVGTASAIDVDTLRDIHVDDDNTNSEERISLESERRKAEAYSLKQTAYAKKHPEKLSYDKLYYDMDEKSAGRTLKNAIQNTQFTKEAIAKNTKKAGLLDKLLAAESLSDKSRVIIENLNTIAKKPADILAHTIDKVDQRLYDIVYDTPIKTKDGKDIKGFLNAMIYKMEGAFDKINSWIDEKILNPVRKKLGGDTVGAIIKNALKGMGIDTEDLSKRIKSYLFGNKDTGEKGLFTDIGKGIKESFSGAFNYIKSAMKDVYGPIFNKIKGHPAEQAANSYMPMSSEHTIAGPKYLSSSSIENAIDADIQEHADGTRVVRKTGLTAISEGEMIIPSELNPFYNKKTSKISQKKKEKLAKSKLAKKIASLVNGDIKENADGDQPVGDSAAGLGAVGATLTNGINQMKTSLFGESAGKDKERFNKVVSDVTSNVSQYAPHAIGAGLLGAGVSILTSAVGGPLLGAAVGASVGIIKDSETVRAWLFGEMKDDERQGGVIGKDIIQNFTKYFPDMGKYGVAGALTAMIPLVPGGPVAGLIIGAGIGFAKNSEKVQEALFGEDEGILGPKFKQTVERAIPHMAIGAGLGLFAGPFGFVGNAAVGAGLGLLTSTNTFQDIMFGEPDKDGKRLGGIMGEIKIAVVDPFKEAANTFKKEVIDFIREEMAKPLRSAMKPISKQIELAIKGMFNFVGEGINKLFESTMGIPLNRFITDKIITPFTKVFGNLFKVLSTPAKFIATSPFKAIGAFGDHLRLKQIKSGNADYMTAQERLDFRRKKGRNNDKFSNFDNMMAGMDEDTLDDMYNQLHNIKNVNRNVKRDVRDSGMAIGKGASDILNKKGEYEQVKRITKFIQSGNVKGAKFYIDSLGLDPERDKALRNLISEQGATFYGSRTAMKDMDSVKGRLYEKLHKSGLTDIDDTNVSKYMSMVGKEKKSRSDSPMTPEMKAEKRGEKIVSILEDSLKQLRLMNDPDRQAKIRHQAENILTKKSGNKEQESKDKYTYDMYGNPMKITHDKQGDETLDISDTDTVKAMDQQKERDDTQKGILSKLGFLEGLKKLFGIGNNNSKESSEKSTLEKMLEMISAAAALSGLAAMAANGDLTKLKTAFQKIIGYEGDDGGFNKALKHGFANFSSRGYSMAKILKKIPIFGKVLEPVGKLMDKPAKMIAESRFGPTILGEKVVRKLAGKDQADKVMDIAKKRAFNVERGINKFADTSLIGGIKGVKNKIVDKAETVYLKGLYGIDALKNAKSKVVNSAVDIGETAYLKYLYGADKVKGSKLGKAVTKAAPKVSAGISSFFSVLGDRIGGVVTKSKDLAKLVVTNVMESFNEVITQPLKDVMNNVLAKGNNLKKSVITKIENIFNEHIVTPLKNIATSISDNILKPALGFVKEKALGAANKVLSGGSYVSGIAKKGVQTASTYVKSKGSQLVASIADSNVGRAAATFGKEVSEKYIAKTGGAVAEEIAEDAGQKVAADGKILNALLNKIKQRFISLVENKVVIKKLGKKGIDALTKGAIPAILKAVKKVVGKSIAKMAAGAMTKGLIQPFWIAAGFIDGYNDANRILGINTEPTLGEKATAGLISGANEIVFGILPESLLVNIFMKHLAPAFGVEDSKLAKERENAQKELDAYNAENGTELTMKEYQEKELGMGGSMGHRIGMSIGKAVGNFGERVGNLFKGKGWNTDEQLGEGGVTTGKRAAEIVEKLKGVGKKALQIATAPIKEVIDLALGKSDKDYWDIGSSGAEDEDSGFLSGIKDLVTLTERVVLSPIYYVVKAGKTLWDKVKDNPTVQALMKGGKYVFSLIKYNLDLALGKVNSTTGEVDIGIMERSAAAISDSDPDAGMKKVLFYGVNTLMMPIFLGLKVFAKVRDFVSPFAAKLSEMVGPIWEGIKGIGSFVWEDTKNVAGILIGGDFSLEAFGKYYTMPVDEDGNSMGGGLKTAMFAISRIVGTIPFAVGMLVRQVPNAIVGFFNLIKGAVTKVKDWSADVSYYSNLNGWGGYWENPDKDSTGLGSAMFMIGRIMTAPAVLIGKTLATFNVGDKLKTFITDKLDWFKNKIVNPFLDFFDLDKYWDKDKGEGSGTTLKADNNDKIINRSSDNGSPTKYEADSRGMITNSGDFRSSGGGSNISQLDPSIKNKRFGNSTIGESGCAPASAAMMINQFGGAANSVGITDLSNTAANYQSKDGGVKAKFFSSAFKKYGMSANYAGNQKDIEAKLKAGSPMVILGQDSGNSSKATSPFGSTPHYVMAQGMDKNGNIIINDPEAPNGKTSSYKAKNILSHSKLGITASGGGSSLGDLFSGKGILGYSPIAYQKLNKFNKLSDADLNTWINKVAPADSPFRNNGAVFNAASAVSGLDPRYLVAHAAQESGWGKSSICKKKGNYFGIKAFDSSPTTSALYMGNSLKAGIVEGAKWIAINYTNKGQDTLYLMEYGPKRYASAVDQWINNIASIMKGAPVNASATTSSSTTDNSTTASWSGFDTQLSSVLGGLSTDVYSDSFLQFMTGATNQKEETAAATVDAATSASKTNPSRSAKNWFLTKLAGSHVSSEYGEKRGNRRHQGIDFAAPAGTPIPSTVSGKVTRVVGGYGGGFGNNIRVVDEFGTEHIYAHMKYKSKLAVGAKVKPGDILGYVGTTGHSTGNHLHYQVNTPNGTVNPEVYLNNYKGSGSNNINSLLDSYTGAASGNVVDMAKYRNNSAAKNGQLLNRVATQNKSSDKLSGKGGADEKGSNMELILSIIKLLVKIIDNTDKLSEIVDILKAEFADTTKSGKGTNTTSSQNSTSKKSAKDKILYLINNSTSDLKNNDNVALLQQLDALARE